MEQIINRAKQFILQPKAAWEEVSTDTSDARSHIFSYVIPLACIPAIATFIGASVIGYSVLGTRYHAPIETGLSQAITAFIGIVLGVILSGKIIQLLAPRFGTEVSVDQTIKMVGFSYTASMIGGIFYLMHSLSILVTLASIYSLYILYLGFRPMTKVSPEKASSYFWVSLVVIILVYIVIAVVLSTILLSIGLGIGAGLG